MEPVQESNSSTGATSDEIERRVLELAQRLKPHAIARELMGQVPIATIYKIIEGEMPGATGGSFWRVAEASLAALDRDLTADDFVAALRNVTGREPVRLSVLQQMSRRSRQGILVRVGKGTYRVAQNQKSLGKDPE